MKKLLIASLLVSGLANANVSTLALTQDVNDSELTLPLTLNNQANAEISSTSELIPAQAKIIAAQDAVIFEVKIPNVTATKRIRYSNSAYGCDFILMYKTMVVE